MGRAPCGDKANVKRGPWSPEEDAKLKDHIKNYGTGGNWIALPHKAGLKRCGKSCRLRWLNYLRPNIKHGEFSSEEDGVICSLHASIGSRGEIDQVINNEINPKRGNCWSRFYNKRTKLVFEVDFMHVKRCCKDNTNVDKIKLRLWSIIAAQLPERTDNDIKNYWNTKLKKKLIGNDSKMISPSTTTNCHQNTLKYQHDQKHHNNPMISSLLSLPPFQFQYNNNDSPTSNIMSFSNISTISQPSLPMQINDYSTLLMFDGHDQQQPSTSDGSCSINNNNQVIVKCEDHNNNNNYGLFNNNSTNNNQVYYEDQKPNLIQINNNKNDNTNTNNNTSNVLWGQNSQRSNNNSLLEYGLEEIKQLISSSNNNEVNYFDEIKSSTEEEDKSKMMYYYNYYLN